MRIHKELGGLNTALAVLLFLAACAWLGAGFYERLDQPRTVRAELSHIRESARLSGIAIREEQLLSAEESVSGLPAAGTRLAAGEELCRFSDGSAEILSTPAVFFPDWDGLEYLRPSRLFPFDAAAAAGLLQAAPEKAAHVYGRLVSDSIWYIAARLEEGSVPLPQSRCRLLAEGLDRELEALVLAVAGSGNEHYVLLRLDEGTADCLRLRFVRAELVNKDYYGLLVPAQAVRQDEAGKNYVEIMAAGLVETKSVDILYREAELCLVEAASLPAGSRVIVPKEGSHYEYR